MNRFSYLFILIFLLVPISSSSQPHLILDDPSLDGLSIEGSIEDNYANLTFAFEISNSEDIADDIVFSFATSSDLFLSNFSLQLTDLTYWGQVKPIETAQQEYQNATENNETAVLVEKVGAFYQTSFNLRPQETGILIFYFEGYIKRVLGAYEFLLVDLTNSFPSATLDVHLDLVLVGSQFQLRSARLLGFNGVSVSQLSSTSYQLTYNGATTINDEINLRYRYFSTGVQTQLLTYSNGSSNFFAYFLAPEVYAVEDIVDREYIFVIDTSGSMGGSRIANAKLAFNSLLDTLTEADLFNIVSFATTAKFFQSEPIVASSSNVEAANTWVNNLVAIGSTNIEQGLSEALAMFSEETDRAKTIVFLSDGQPTLGLGSGNDPVLHQELVETIAERNTVDATIYSVSLGLSTAEGLMASLAYQSGGEFVVITDANTLDLDLSLLYETFRYPVGTSLNIDYVGTEGIVFPNTDQLSNTIFNGSELIQTGIYSSSLDIETTLITGSGTQIFTATATSTNNSLDHIERMWAINQINALLRLNVLANKAELRSQIVQLAMYYQLVVEDYTALILVVEEPEEPDTSTDTNSDNLSGTTFSTTQTQGTTQGTTQVPTTNNDASDTDIGAGGNPIQNTQDTQSGEADTDGGQLDFPTLLFLLLVFIPLVSLKRNRSKANR